MLGCSFILVDYEKVLTMDAMYIFTEDAGVPLTS